MTDPPVPPRRRDDAERREVWWLTRTVFSTYRQRPQQTLLLLLLVGLNILLSLTLLHLQKALDQKQRSNVSGQLLRNTSSISDDAVNKTTPHETVLLLAVSPEDSSSSTTRSKLVQPFHIPSRHELHTERRRRRSHTADVYWQRAVTHLLADWDATVDTQRDGGVGPLDATTTMTPPLASHSRNSNNDNNNNNSSTSSTPLYTRDTLGWLALVQASELGHPGAQYVVANALASGVWPMERQPDVLWLRDTTDASFHHLRVQDTYLDAQQSQQSRAMLLWHLAALAGHVEAAMTLAHRYEERRKLQLSAGMVAAGSGNNINNNVGLQDFLRMALGVATGAETHVNAANAMDSVIGNSRAGVNSKHGSSSGKETVPKVDWCEQVKPYYEAAAHGIIDLLEADPQSRAKVLPAREGHFLHQVHLHGGTGSQLEYHNKPDESASALQFYHVKAIDPHTGLAASPHAAFTLAQWYHYGSRGVAQNVTLAVQYYVLAAQGGHWEAAGQAGDFYFWGIGVEHDPYEARKYYRLGMPFGLEGCRNNFERKMRQPKNDATVEIHTCDATSINGMGLLTLLGLPMIHAVDEELATAYFQLAKDQGNRDAFYNMAMTKLGYKTHFRPIEEMDSKGQTKLRSVSFSKEQSSEWNSHPTHQELQAVLSDLTAAAGKGHLQAKHRLAMMYSTGVFAPHKNVAVQVIPKDCEKSVKNFRWIIENASPQRSKRLRKAYKQYVAGDWSASLRNYLAAAESGSDLAQVNAAFLLEQGVCLGLDRVDCAKASVRLWKAAATKGNAEASLRVGDFYYYGRLRKDDDSVGVVGPFGFVHYLLYPEQFFIGFVNRLQQRFIKPTNERIDDTCTADNDSDQTCENPVVDKPEEEHTLEKDLKTASNYYRMAAERSNPRANFNLGFLYEWGLGLKQDFHLAKRHYDLAVAGQSREAELAVALVLMEMSVHRFVVKGWLFLEELFGAKRKHETENAAKSEKNMADQSKSVTPVATDSISEPGKLKPFVADPHRPKRTKMDVALEHLLSWETLVILLLSILLLILIRRRQQTRR